MIWVFDPESGEAMGVSSEARVQGRTVLPNPPSDTGWRWDPVTAAWQEIGPRDWPLRGFLNVLFTPAEFLAIRLWQPAGAPTADDLVFLWAREMVLTLPRVNLDDPNTSAALAMCAARGLLTEARVLRVLKGLPPV